MTEALKKKDYLKIISVGYLILFCILKLFTVTQPFQDIEINSIMFALGCIILFFILIKNKFKLKYSKILTIFIIVIIINMLFNFDMATIKSGLFEIFYIFTIYIISYEYFNEKYYLKLLKIIITLTFIFISIFMINYLILFAQSGTLPTKSMIAYLVFSNINGGATLALINIIMIMYMCKIKAIKKPIAIFLNVYYIVFLIISQARTSLYTLIILVCYLVFSKLFINSKYDKIKRVLKILFVMCVIIVMIIMSVLLLKRDYDFATEIDNTIYNLEKKIASFTTLRYWLWKYSIEELIDTNPLFGLQFDFGEESFENIKDLETLNSLSESQKDILSRNNVHNGFVEVLVRNGILGFTLIILYYILLGTQIFKLGDDKAYYKYIKYLYLYYILINLFENNLLLSNSFLVLFLWMHIGMDNRIIADIKKRKTGEL